MMPSHVFVPVKGDRVYAIAFSASGGQLLNTVWESPEIHPSTSVLQVSDLGAMNGLYVGSSAGRIYRLNSDTGAVMDEWTQGIDDVHELAYADGMLYFIAGDVINGFQDVKLGAFNPMAGLIFWTNPGAHTQGLAVGLSRIFANLYTNLPNGPIYQKLYAFHLNGSPAWVSEVAEFFGDIIALGNAVYTWSWGRVLKLNAANGAVIWDTDTYESGWSPTGLTVGGGYVYAVGDDRVGAFSTIDGLIAWQAQVSDPPYTGALTDPAYYNGQVFVATMASAGARFLYALNASSGSVLWKSEIPVAVDDIYVSHATADCELVCVTSQDGNFYAFHTSNGELSWKTPIATDPKSAPSPRPTIVCEPIKPRPRPRGPFPERADPLSFILPGHVYAALNLPYPPPVERVSGLLRSVAKRMKPEDKRDAVARARALAAYAEAVEKELGGE